VLDVSEEDFDDAPAVNASNYDRAANAEIDEYWQARSP
jgi:hypothetical protein